MRHEIVQLVFQKRFRLMNRWFSVAMKWELKPEAVPAPVFRRFIFGAFDGMGRALRKEQGMALAEVMESRMFPDTEAFRSVLGLGGEAVDEFLASDGVGARGFDRDLLETARESAKIAIAGWVDQETKAYDARWKPKETVVAQCSRCVRG